MTTMNIIPGGISLTLEGKAITKHGLAGSLGGFWLRVAVEGKHEEVYIPFNILQSEDIKRVIDILNYTKESG